MSWASGSLLCTRILYLVLPAIDSYEIKKRLCKDILEEFKDYDCDALCEVVDNFEGRLDGDIVKEAYEELYK